MKPTKMLKKTAPLALLLAAMACKSPNGVVKDSVKDQASEVLTSQKKSSPAIPNDPSVVKGVLSNGMTYYLKNNGKPADKVELRLVVNAGSILEDDDQQGLAHFMEHMNFNGTKNFKKNELVDYLQSIGVKFGSHLNAYTGFDETVYILPIPSDDPEKLDKGFQIIEDWAFNAQLTDEEINKERGVVLEELRTGLGAEKRMLQKYLGKVVYNSKYSKRLPIGKKDILENFNPDVLRRFHKDWYRPDLMAIIAVGDVDVAVLEEKVKKHFGSYPAVENKRERKVFSSENHSETFIAIESDKEATANQVQLMYKSKVLDTPALTENDLREELIEGFFAMMINARLGELRNSDNPPFVYGYSYNGGTWVRNQNAYQSVAMANQGKELEALKTLVVENERVKRFGFQSGEFSRVKKQMFAQIDRMYQNKDKQESRTFTQSYIENFLQGEAIPSLDWTVSTMKAQVPTITLGEINELIKKYITEDNRVVIIKGKDKNVTEAEVLEVLNAVKNDATIQPYQDKTVRKSLFETLPKKGSIVSETKNDVLNITTLKLNNGATVTYKKTDFKDNEVLFQAQSYGGNSLFTIEDYKASKLGMRSITTAGIAGLTKNDLTKFLTGKIVRVSPYLRSLSEEMNGSSTPKDIETLFQLIHLNFTSINKDEKAFKASITKYKSMMGNLLERPDYYFYNELNKFKNKENPRYTGFPTDEDFDNVDYDLAYKLFTERFKNAGDFSFYFVGNIDEAKLKALSEQYLASLPSTNNREEFKDLGFRPLKGKHSNVFKKGNDPKSQVYISYEGEAKYTENDAVAFKALSEILSIKMVEKLREEAAGVYSPSVSGGLTQSVFDTYSLNVSFGCGPENVDKLKAIVFSEIEKIKAEGPSVKDVNKAKEAFLLARKEALEHNKFWLSTIADSNFDKKDVNGILNYTKIVNALTAKNIQDIAVKYLNKNIITNVLMPE